MKDELEHRGLETSGSKAALVERLQNALKSEGLNPNTYLFQTPAKALKKVPSPIKMPVDAVLIKEEPLDDDNPTAEEEETNGSYQHAEEGHLVDEVGEVDDECVIIEDDDEYFANGEDQNEEEEEAAELEHEQEEPAVEIDEENAGDGNNPDNEESINLTIGEEEQNLLHEEASDDKVKSTADEHAKAVRKEGEEKGAGKEVKAESHVKEVTKAAKAEEGTKAKAKSDEKSTEKKITSEQKSTIKTTQKDDKEKTAAVSSNTAGASAASDAAKSASAAKNATQSRNLWVSGLSSLTRASDLKTIFTKYGKVIGAKVVTNTRTPGTRCYGYVTMSSSTDASRCIEHLHRTELHGRIISVERTKNEIGSNATSANRANVASKGKDDKRTSSADKKRNDEKRSAYGSRKDDSRRDDKYKKDEKDKESGKEKDNKDRTEVSPSKRPSRRTTRSADRTRNDRSRDLDREQRQKERERERERIRQREILSYQKIREERERQRLREKERELREEERRRREIRERQRQEEQRLAEERKKLALERERLEREKAELIRLERERQKLEREKIELERLELKRQQMKIIQTREEPAKRPAKRAGDERYTDVTDRKRSSGNENRFEAPPPPRFDAALVSSRSYDKKREEYGNTSSSKRGIDDYTSSKRQDYSSKRDDYSSATNKRSAVDDYPPAPPKRSTDDYSKRSTGDYISSSSSKHDYSSSKRDDYSSSKPQRDDYKREVELRHIPSSNTGGSSTYIHKNSGTRYGEPDMRSAVSNFRRIDDRNDVRSATSGKRYDGSGGYGNNNSSVWTPANSSHMGHSSSSGVPTLKSYVSNGLSSVVHSSSTWQKSTVGESNWRPVPSSQDRYDRTYNERSSGYVDSSRPSGGMYGGSGRPNSDRYGGTISSRY